MHKKWWGLLGTRILKVIREILMRTRNFAKVRVRQLYLILKQVKCMTMHLHLLI